MNLKQGIVSLLGLCIGSIVSAGNMGSSHPIRPLISLQGGYASINWSSRVQSFSSTDSDVFNYTNSQSKKNKGFIGVFLGVEKELAWLLRPGFFIQTGVEYNYFGTIDMAGMNTVGIEPETDTRYTYNYHFKSQQLLGTLKLFSTTYQRFYPYAEAGLGAAFNHAGQYNAITSETDNINLTPRFNNRSATKFSYSLGVGINTRITTNLRVGLGYRYTNLGASSLGDGTVFFNEYQYPVPFTLGDFNNNANQLIASLTYVV